MSAQPKSRLPNIEADAYAFCERQYDFIIVGGGTAGLPVASRLAIQHRSLCVGVIEAGPDANGEPDIESISSVAGSTIGGRYVWKFETTPQKDLCGRKLVYSGGKVLGGSSAINFLIWNHASPSEYDEWEALGNTGWA